MPDTALSFVTSLRHPETTDDYPAVEALLSATLRSLDAQLDKRFEVQVVANRPYATPAGLSFPVRTHVVDFPRPPRTFATKEEKNASIKLDKGLKLSVAMIRSVGAYAMCLDSDDFVSRRVVQWVAQQDGTAKGWYVERGIRYDVSQGLYRPLRNFNDVCGTSLIWQRELMPTVTVSDDPTPDEVLAAYGRDRVVEELGSHRELRRRYGFEALPFAGAAYAVGHGNNHSDSARSLLGTPIGKHAAEYGIAAPPAAVQRKNAAAQLRPAHLRELARAVTLRLGR